jgi:hypothetical protein
LKISSAALPKNKTYPNCKNVCSTPQHPRPVTHLTSHASKSISRHPFHTQQQKKDNSQVKPDENQYSVTFHTLIGNI